MATDITLDLLYDGSTHINAAFLNKNVRDALISMLSPDTLILTKTNTMTIAAWPAWTAITWNNLVFDSDSALTPQWTSGNPTRLICMTAGWYEIDFTFPMSMDTENNATTVAVRVNGDDAQIYAGDTFPCESGTWNFGGNFTTMIPLQVQDYVETIVRITRSASQPSTNMWNGPRVVFRRVRRL